jgi:hypothetical protein
MKNTSNTCVMLTKTYRGEAIKKSSVFEWHKWFKESLHFKITNDDIFFDIKGIVHFKFILQDQTKVIT